MSRFLITTYHGSGSPQIPGTDGNTYKDDDDDTIYYYDDGWVSTTAPTWRSAMTGLPANTNGSVNCSVVYMGGVFYMLVGNYNTNDTDIYTTTDFQLWTSICTLTDVRPQISVLFQTFVTDGTNLYFLSSNPSDVTVWDDIYSRVYKSDDNGLTWTPTDCPTFAAIVYNGTNLFIARLGNTYEVADERVWTSTDGVSWTVTTGLTNLNVSNVSAFGTSGSAVYIRNKDDGAGGDGLFAYCTNNSTWSTSSATAISDGTRRSFDGNGTLVLQASDVAILKSSSIGGAFGSSVYSGNVRTVKQIASAHYFATLVAGGLIESTDSGDNWTALTTGVGADSTALYSIANNGETSIVVCRQVDAVYARI